MVSSIKKHDGVHADAPEWARVDEPVMPTEAHQKLWRDYVRRMEDESNPEGLALISIAIRELARDHVVSLIADQTGEPKARQLERDRRKMGLMKEIAAAASRRGDGVDPVRFAVALVEEIMPALESGLAHQPELAVRVKEDVGSAVVDFTRDYVKRLRS